MIHADELPPTGRSYTCLKGCECFFCYEMNRDKSERNLIMPKITPAIFKSVKEYKIPKKIIGNGGSRNIILDPETGKEMYMIEAAITTGYTYKHIVNMLSGRKANFTGLIRVA